MLGRAPGHQGLQVEGTRAPDLSEAPGFAREGTEAWGTLKIKERRRRRV